MNPDDRELGELPVPPSVAEKAAQAGILNTQQKGLTPGAPASIVPPQGGPKLTDLVREIRMSVADPVDQQKRLDVLRQKVLRQEILKSIELSKTGDPAASGKFAVRSRWIDEVFRSPVGNWGYNPVIVAGPDAPTAPPPDVAQRVLNAALEGLGIQPVPTAQEVTSGELARQMVAQQEAKLPEGVKPPDDKPLEAPSMFLDPETFLPVGTIKRVGEGIIRNVPAMVIGAGLRAIRGGTRRFGHVAPPTAPMAPAPPVVPPVAPPTGPPVTVQPRGVGQTLEKAHELQWRPANPTTIYSKELETGGGLDLGEAGMRSAQSRGRYRSELGIDTSRQTRPDIVDDAPPLPTPRSPDAPPVAPRARASWWNPFRSHVTDPQGHKGWEAAQRAWNTSGHLGPVRAEMLRKEFAANIPNEFHHASSQFLDTGDVRWLASMPENVQQAMTRFRAVTNEFRDKALASGALSNENIVDDYFTHLIKSPSPGVAAEVRVRMSRSLQPNSPFFKERSFPTLDELEGWLRSEGLDALGVTVDRNPANVMQAYVRAFYKHEGLSELGSRLTTDLLPNGRPPLIGADDLANMGADAANYTAFNEPYFRKLVNGTPMIDKRYREPLSRLKAQLEFRGGFDTNTLMGQVADGWDKFNNLHRRLVMALPHKHGLFNVGFDALAMTGLWQGVVKGDWLRARREGVKHMQELTPFTADLIRYGNVHMPTLRDRMHGFRTEMDDAVQGMVGKAMDAAGNKIAPYTKPALDAMDKLVWEQMVGGWTVGTAKLLFDRAEAGQMPRAFLSRGLTQEAWQRLSYEEKIGVVGRTVGWASGQVSEMMFKNPDTIQKFRQVLFSPMWNASNIAIVRAALDPMTGGTGGFAMKGLSPDQRRVVSAYMQSYLMRSLAYSYGSTVLANMTTTMLLDGEAKGPWENAEGYRARIYAGRDPDDRTRYVMSPLGYMAKDLGHLLSAGAQFATSLDPTEAQQMVFSKLAQAPKTAVETLAGYTPFFRQQAPEKGVTAKDRFFNSLEYAANTVVPVEVWKRDPVGGAMATSGFFFKRPLTPSQVESLMNRELSRYSGMISTAQRRGQDTKALQAQQLRAQQEWQVEFQKAVAADRLHRASGVQLK